ncbi:hypothetical protein ACB092_01G060100 [Castanea dentata]
MVMLMWTIWFRQNQLRKSNKDYPITPVVPTAQDALQVLRQANTTSPSQISIRAPPRVRWTPPPANSLKVNFDGATFRDIWEGDFEAVINTLSSAEVSLSFFGHILTLAKATTRANCCISFSHTCRIGNSIAHNLAKHARHVGGFWLWMEDVPPHLYFVLYTNNS